MPIEVVDRYILAVYHSLGIVGWLVFFWMAWKIVKFLETWENR